MSRALGLSMARLAKHRGVAAGIILVAVAALALTVAAQARHVGSPSRRVPCRMVCVKIVPHPPPHVSACARRIRLCN
jgi:hypothetical protein